MKLQINDCLLSVGKIVMSLSNTLTLLFDFVHGSLSTVNTNRDEFQ